MERIPLLRASHLQSIVLYQQMLRRLQFWSNIVAASGQMGALLEALGFVDSQHETVGGAESVWMVGCGASEAGNPFSDYG